jgi:hypothetical protein
MGMLCCRFRRQIGADYTDFSLDERKMLETRENALAVPRFQASFTPRSVDTDRAMRLHKVTGGHSRT